VPDTNKNFEAKITFEDATSKDPLEETFFLSLAPNIASNLSAMGSTSPYAFVFNDSSKVEDFLNNGHSLGYANAEVTLEIVIPLTQADCESAITTGDYTNYRRWMDSSGTHYDGTEKIIQGK
jgi:hypothetical protein